MDRTEKEKILRETNEKWLLHLLKWNNKSVVYIKTQSETCDIDDIPDSYFSKERPEKSIIDYKSLVS